MKTDLANPVAAIPPGPSFNWDPFSIAGYESQAEERPSPNAAQEALPQAPAPAEVAHPAPNEEEV